MLDGGLGVLGVVVELCVVGELGVLGAFKL